MIKIKFNLGQRVRIVEDKMTDYFTGCEGEIIFMGRNKDKENMYGIQLTKPNELMDIIDFDTIFYFDEDELEGIDNIDITYTFV